MTTGTYDAEVSAMLNDALARMGWSGFSSPDGEARHTLWRCRDGWLVGYTTERIKGGPFDGKFAALAYRPIGKGARSGKASGYKRVYFRGFAQRKTAKARADRMYAQHAKVAK